MCVCKRVCVLHNDPAHSVAKRIITARDLLTRFLKSVIIHLNLDDGYYSIMIWSVLSYN